MLVLFIKKPGGEIQFYIDYRKLNAIKKKNHCSIFFIKKILAQLEGSKYFTKIDIHQTFYQIKISEDLEEFTTFLIRFDIFKYLIILFDLYNSPAS